jgi:suppressor of ftsI
VLFPGQRRIVDVRFDEARTYTLRHEAGDQRWEMATVSVTDTPATPDLEATYDALMEHPSVIRDIDRFRIYFDRPVDRQLLLTMRTAGDPGDAAARGAPADVTIRDAQWVIADAVSGDENLGINMNFRVGDVVKLLITNDADVPHPTTHTLHLHGQRFLILHRDGEPVANMVWTDTAHVKPGESIEILADLSNAGDWMFRSHIAELLQGGMAIILRVGS